MDMRDLIRKRLGLVGPATSTEPPPSSSSSPPDSSQHHTSEEEQDPSHNQPVSVCDCGKCQEFVPIKSPSMPQARTSRGRGRGAWGRGGGAGTKRQDDDDAEGGSPTVTTSCASCGCDIINHVVPGQLEDEDGFEDEDYEPVYGEND